MQLRRSALVYDSKLGTFVERSVEVDVPDWYAERAKKVREALSDTQRKYENWPDPLTLIGPLAQELTQTCGFVVFVTVCPQPPYGRLGIHAYPAPEL